MYYPTESNNSSNIQNKMQEVSYKANLTLLFLLITEASVKHWTILFR